MRNRFDRELKNLNQELIEMGILIEQAIENAVHAFIERDPAQARLAIEYDSEVDQKEREIERRCLRLLLEQQPVARDLRMISTALKIITDMERIGDQASDISEIVLRFPGGENRIGVTHIQDMAKAAIHMVKQSITAFIERDFALANRIIAYDDVVDGLFNSVKADIIALIAADPAGGEQSVDLLMVAKYFERIGDHATNIAEWIVFSITGEHKNEKVI